MSYHPIAELSAWGRRDWTIKARVSTRQRMREFKRASGEASCVLGVDLIDAAGSEIRASLWGQCAKDHDDMLKQGRVFTFSKGAIKVANKKFSSCKHDYELSFSEQAVIKPAEDDAAIQQIKYTFVELRKLRELTLPCTVDLCVVVKEMQPPKDCKGGALWMRKCLVVDPSQNSIEVAVFDETMSDEDLTGRVLTLKSVNVKEYNGMSASVSGPNVKVGADLPEAVALQQWWASGGQASAAQAMSNTGTGGGGAGNVVVREGSLAELRSEADALEMGKALFWNASLPVYFAFLRTTNKEGQQMRLTYDACPTCRKKTIENMCAKCEKEVAAEPRLIMSGVRLQDESGEQEVSLFDQAGATLVGMNAQEVHKVELEEEAILGKLQKRYFRERFSAKLRAKTETYEGNATIRKTLIGVNPLDETEHARKLLAQLAAQFPMFGGGKQELIKGLLADLKDGDMAAPRAGAWTEDLTRLAAVVA